MHEALASLATPEEAAAMVIYLVDAALSPKDVFVDLNFIPYIPVLEHIATLDKPARLGLASKLLMQLQETHC